MDFNLISRQIGQDRCEHTATSAMAALLPRSAVRLAVGKAERGLPKPSTSGYAGGVVTRDAARSTGPTSPSPSPAKRRHGERVRTGPQTA